MDCSDSRQVTATTVLKIEETRCLGGRESPGRPLTDYQCLSIVISAMATIKHESTSNAIAMSLPSCVVTYESPGATSEASCAGSRRQREEGLLAEAKSPSH